MKIQALYDLNQEINRLFIAGSKFAKGDPRISKHIPVLAKLGEKAPVFKKLAQDIEELTKCEASESSEKLLNISVLLYSVLYTQGETTTEEETQAQQASYPLQEVKTSTSYLGLKPVIVALSSSSQGRMAIVEDAYSRGVFNDFRTFDYVCRALGDKYAELADYIERTVIPSIGPRILPFLKAGFKIEGRSEDVRRFRLMYKLGDPDIKALVEQVLANSPSAALQAEAVLVLSDDPKNEQMVLGLADDKKKEVREAAYMSLAKLNTKECLEKLTQLFVKGKKGSMEGLVRAIGSTSMPHFLPEVLQKVKTEYQTFVSMKATMDNQKEVAAAYDKLAEVLPSVYGKIDDEVVLFLTSIVTDKAFAALATGGDAVRMIRSIVDNLIYIGKKGTREVKALAADSAVLKRWGRYVIEPYFAHCAKQMTAKELYDNFHTHYTEKRLYPRVILEECVDSGHEFYSYRTFWENFLRSKKDFSKVDPRWADLLLNNASIKEDEERKMAYFMGINCCNSSDDRLRKALRGNIKSILLKKNIPDDFLITVQRMKEVQLPDYQELVMQVFDQMPCSQSRWSFLDYHERRTLELLDATGLLKEFPKSYAARFRAIAAKNTTKDSRDTDFLEGIAFTLEQEGKD